MATFLGSSGAVSPLIRNEALRARLEQATANVTGIGTFAHFRYTVLSSRQGGVIPLRPRLVSKFIAALAVSMLLGVHAARGDPPQPVPSDAALAKAGQVIHEIYGRDYKDATPVGRRKLAQKLVIDGRALENDPPGKYALLREAHDLAISVTDAGTALAAVEALGQSFAVDGSAMTVDVLYELDGKGTAAQSAAMADAGLKLLPVLIREQRYELAVKLANVTQRAASRSHQEPMLTAARFWTAQAVQIAAEAERARAAVEKLKKDPNDREASTTLGSFLCFYRGDWDAGLLALARGSDPALRKVALADLAYPQDSAATQALAGSWWDLAAASQGQVAGACRARSAAWYKRGLEVGLKGLERSLAQRRIADAGVPPVPLHPPPVAPLPATPPAVVVSKPPPTPPAPAPVVSKPPPAQPPVTVATTAPPKQPPIVVTTAPPASAPAVVAAPKPPARLDAESLTNSVGMKLVLIRPGEFVMGSPRDEPGRGDDETPHHVKITHSFMMSATPVTQAQWTAIMGQNPSRWQGENLPVEKVSLVEAEEFCQKLGAEESRHYRLPTEAEWEYACRAGTTAPFAGTGNPEAMGWCGPDSGGMTHRVGEKKPNAWGLYDMHGNVLQWCSDAYAPYSGDATDPAGGKDLTSRVLRGGSWLHDANRCRSAARHKGGPDYRDSYIGFRVCLDAQTNIVASAPAAAPPSIPGVTDKPPTSAPRTAPPPEIADIKIPVAGTVGALVMQSAEVDSPWWQADAVCPPKVESREGWRTVPPVLLRLNATSYSHARTGAMSGLAEFEVTRSGYLLLGCNWGYQGNPSGNWQKSVLEESDFIKQGWQKVDDNVFGGQLVRLEGYEQTLFIKHVEKGEKYKLRCNKYYPPYPIVFR